MAGLDLRSLHYDDQAQAALKRKKSFKPAENFNADPVPTVVAGRIKLPAWRPGSSAPDPVPAIAADETTFIQSFRPNVGLSVDPVPARSA